MLVELATGGGLEVSQYETQLAAIGYMPAACVICGYDKDWPFFSVKASILNGNYWLYKIHSSIRISINTTTFGGGILVLLLRITEHVKAQIN